MRDNIALLALLSTAAAFASTSAMAQAYPTQHVGSADPLTEGFTQSVFQPDANEFAVTNDLGVNAWEIQDLSTASQISYVSAPFTSEQKTQLATNGFTVTYSGRVLPGAGGLVYTSAVPIVLGDAGIDNGTRRYEIMLGLDSSGDTVAVLPTSINNAGPGSSLQAFGPSYVTGRKRLPRLRAKV